MLQLAGFYRRAMSCLVLLGCAEVCTSPPAAGALSSETAALAESPALRDAAFEDLEAHAAETGSNTQA